MRFIKTAAAWLVAAFIASVAASVASSQQVMASLVAVGAKISVSQRLSMTWADFGILETLFPVMAVCFLVGFMVAAQCHKRLHGSRNLWYIAAGASSIICTLLLMSTIMILMPVAGARGPLGMALIGACGALGGLLFARLTSSIR